ncbi:MAG: glutamine-hydrolyzing carbamoyl-phosphate synthase small subunit [Candidatus Peregrinibacteria bacterium]|nr:glutamine-hydrolyzing carbamoyl-phosphate synthase small subunit [Candidatus Peregrinibacteria bacterium]
MNAKLILKDGTIFEGKSFGADVSVAGEVVFNTSMVGYPESFTDPSYTGQILVLTSPLVGNYGVPDDIKDKDQIEKIFEGKCMSITGLIVNEYSENFSHWNAKKSLGQWLKENKIPAITGIDTRELTKKLRTHGVMLGKIVVENPAKKSTTKSSPEIEFLDPNSENLVDKVSIKKPKIYKRGKKTIICIDCGMKNNIIRNFLDRDITVIRVPWNYNFLEEKIDGKEIKFDGIFMSNGPGDPAILTKLHEIIKKAFALKKPIFGICLGCQIMAIASGAKTYKLKFGHRSQNQPCIDLNTNPQKCYITSQNHGFAIDEKSLRPGWEVWLKNANDQTIEGIRHKTLPFFSCQFHPEAAPGPLDTVKFFDDFIKML